MPYPQIIASKLGPKKPDPETDPVTEGTDEGADQIALNQAQSEYEKNFAKYSTNLDKVRNEKKRVQAVKDKAVDTVNMNLGVTNNQTGLLPKMGYSWLEKGYTDPKSVGSNVRLYGCNATTCGAWNKSGAYLPDKVLNPKTDQWEDNTVSYAGKSYKGGDALPMVTGNTQFDEMSKNFGFHLKEKGSLPESGDLVRVNYDNRPGHPNYNPDERQKGTTHSVTAAKNTATGEMQGFYNPGYVAKGIQTSTHYTQPESFDPSKQTIGSQKNRVMEFKGNLPYLQDKFKKEGGHMSVISPKMRANLKKSLKTAGFTNKLPKVTGNMSGLNKISKMLKRQ